MQNWIQIILFTELGSEGKAGEILNPVPINGIHIEPDHKRCKQTNKYQQGDDYHSPLTVLVHSAKGDVGQESKRKQEATEEAKDVCNIVNPW